MVKASAADFVRGQIKDAVTAGALATAFNVLGVAASIDLAAQYPEASYLIVDKDGAEYISENWPATSTEKSAISLVNVKEKMWTAGQSLDIKFELARFEGRARRPFVAVWIEDADHKPVRRIAVWYNKPRWLPDLRSWFAAKREAEFDVASTTGATRGAGQYTLVWDGKKGKDREQLQWHQGKSVGDYTLKNQQMSEWSLRESSFN